MTIQMIYQYFSDPASLYYLRALGQGMAQSLSGMIVSASRLSPVCFFRLDGKLPETESGITGSY